VQAYIRAVEQAVTDWRAGRVTVLAAYGLL